LYLIRKFSFSFTNFAPPQMVASNECLPGRMAASIALQKGREGGADDRVATSGSGGELAVLQVNMETDARFLYDCYLTHVKSVAET
jgi:hypothetical protein